MKVEYDDHMGSDLTVVNKARGSFGKRVSTLRSRDIALINYLARGCPSDELHALSVELVDCEDRQRVLDGLVKFRATSTHWVPFAHPQISLTVSAPLPQRTQCFKHKVGFVESEESRRYIRSKPVVYVPDQFRAAAENVKQGSGGVHYRSDHWRNEYRILTNDAVETYMAMIDDGVCPEQARYVLPQGTEVTWGWTGSLYAFSNFCRQRLDPHAQEETRVLAGMVRDIIRPLFPHSWRALETFGVSDE